MSKSSPFSRRTFLSAVPCALTAGWLGFPTRQAPRSARTQALPQELSPEEQAWVKKSSMAQDLKNFFHEGYSCAESILMVGLRYLEESEDLVWTAAGFGGGMGQKALCGFLTGGAMVLGLAAGNLDSPRAEAKKRCGSAVRSYWSWWKEQAPLNCADIRPPGSESAICGRLGLLASARVEEIIDLSINS